MKPQNVVREFGIGLYGIDLRPKDMLEIAEFADNNGFGICWVAEDYFMRGAFSLAGACAARTKSVRIGIGAVNPYSRHPALTAMETAGLAGVAGRSRAVLALGASNKAWIEKMAIPYVEPRRSLADSVEIIRAMFQGTSVTYSGKRYQVSDVKLSIPLEELQVPIYLGVVGTKNLELAGEVADGVLLSVMTSPAYVRYACDRIQHGMAKQGRSVPDFDVQAYLLFSIDKDRDRGRNAIRPFIGSLVGMAGFFGPDPLLTSTGLDPKELKPLTEGALRGEDVGHLVSDWIVDTFTISGTPEDCQERLGQLISAGLTSPVVFETPGLDFRETLANVQKYILPYFPSQRAQ